MMLLRLIIRWMLSQTYCEETGFDGHLTNPQLLERIPISEKTLLKYKGIIRKQIQQEQLEELSKERNEDQ